MFSRIQERFGTAGLVVAIVALIAVLGGTAFAASGGLTGKQKKEVKKIAKSFQGQGPVGPQGPAGANGTNGTNGKDGAPGGPGTPGAPGKSVVSEEEEPGSNCEAGGYSFEVEDSNDVNYVCNGTEGSGGGGAGGSQTVLAPGELMTGTWVMESIGLNEPRTAISFPLQVPDGSLTEVEIVEPSGTPTATCPGTSENPDAAEGGLCYYEQATSGLAHNWFLFQPIDYSSGEVLAFEPASTTERAQAEGTWALRSLSAAP